MKKLLLALALTVAIPAQASSYSYCVSIQQVARATMSAYQTGVPKSQLLEIANSPTTYRIVFDATSRYRFLTEEFRQQAATDFGVEYFAMCLDGEI